MVSCLSVILSLLVRLCLIVVLSLSWASSHLVALKASSSALGPRLLVFVW